MRICYFYDDDDDTAIRIEAYDEVGILGRVNLRDNIITSLRAFKQGCGVGTLLMQRLIAKADTLDIPFLTVYPSPDHSGDMDRLIRFYRSFGFSIPDIYGNMRRDNPNV